MATVNECGIAAKKSATCTEACRTCQRVGIPILPLRYAVIPKEKTKGRSLLGGEVLSGGKKLSAPDLGKNYKVNRLQEHAYSLRTLRTGFVYVFLEATKVWQGYGVKKDGLLTQLPDYYKPLESAQEALTPACVAANDNIPAAFINIPNIEATPTIWIAYSPVAWDKAVFERYASKLEYRARRMTKLELKQLKTKPTQGDAFELDPGLNTLWSWVEEYAATVGDTIKRAAWNIPEVNKLAAVTPEEKADKEALIKAEWSTYSMYERSSTFGKLAAFVKKNNAENKMPVIAVALDDVSGMLQDLNYSKSRETMAHKIWLSTDERGHKYASSQAIKSVQHYLEVQKRAETQVKSSKNSGKNLKLNNEAVSIYDGLEIPKTEYENKLISGEIPSTVSWTQTRMVNGVGAFGRLKDHSKVFAYKSIAEEFSKFSEQYNEKARFDFEQAYNSAVKANDQKLKALDHDHALWLTHDSEKSDRAKPAGLVSLCELDFVQKDQINPNYTILVGSTLEGALLYDNSIEWMFKRLSKSPNEPDQILIRALVGNHKEFLSELAGEKWSRVYDISKTIFTTQNKQGGKEISVFVSAKVKERILTPLTELLSQATSKLAKRLKPNQLAAIDTAVDVATNPGAPARVRVKIQNVSANALAEVYQDVNKTVAATRASNKGKKGSRNKAKKQQTPKLKRDVKISYEVRVEPRQLTEIVGDLTAAGAAGASANVIKISFSDKIYALTPEQARRFLTKVHGNISANPVGRDGLLAAGSLYYQIRGFNSAYQALLDAAPDESLGAWATIGSSSLSLISGSTDGARVALTVLRGETSLVKFLVKFSGWAGVVGGGVDVFIGGKNGYEKLAAGDNDAAILYGLGTITSIASVAISGCILAGSASSVLLASAGSSVLLLGLGPVGWVILLGLATATLFYFASEAEDSEAGKWAARNKFWSLNKRKGEAKFQDWQQEENALQKIFYSINAYIEYDDGFHEDTVSFRVKIGRYSDTENAWRYRVIGILKDKNKEVEIETRRHPAADEFPNKITPVSNYPISINRAPGTVKIDAGSLEIKNEFSLKAELFSAMRLECDFFLDIVNEPERITPIQLTSQYDEEAHG